MNTAISLTGPETPEEAKYNDHAIDAALKQLTSLTGAKYRQFNSTGYHQNYELVSQTFRVRKSSITTRMARLLYGLSDTFQPMNVAVIGSAESNALVWLAIPVLSTAHKILGVDLDKDDNKTSLVNIKSFGAEQIEIKTMDGMEAKNEFTDKIDLLFIDVWSQEYGKTNYFDILDQNYPALAKGALILAHDITYPKFRNDMAGYISMVRDKNRFQHTCSIPVDRYGLEVTIR